LVAEVDHCQLALLICSFGFWLTICGLTCVLVTKLELVAVQRKSTLVVASAICTTVCLCNETLVCEYTVFDTCVSPCLARKFIPNCKSTSLANVYTGGVIPPSACNSNDTTQFIGSDLLICKLYEFSKQVSHSSPVSQFAGKTIVGSLMSTPSNFAL
jgi:hypothetical protein